MSEFCKETIKKLAMKTNNETWSFFTKEDLSQEDISKMLENAFTSLSLWSEVGTDINMARGHWMLSRAFCMAENKEQAMFHSDMCERFTEKAEEGKADFDLFYSLEAKSRANALCGNLEAAKLNYDAAIGIANNIEDKQTKDLCMSDLKSKPWFNFSGEEV